MSDTKNDLSDIAKLTGTGKHRAQIVSFSITKDGGISIGGKIVICKAPWYKRLFRWLKGDRPNISREKQ
jgi:hypothetical protein